MAKAKAKAKAAAGKAKKKKKPKKVPKACKNCKAKTCKELYEKHQEELKEAKPSELNATQKADLAKFQKNYAQNIDRYQAVSKEVNMPSEWIAAIHWRESTGNFGTYLHQGDPLGKPAVNVPNNIPTFQKDEWDKAAAHALNMKKKCREELGIDKDTKDRAKLAAYSEQYNGLGYSHYHNQNSPYVYSGLDSYSVGKYTSDGSFSGTAVDQQLGTVTLVDSITNVGM